MIIKCGNCAPWIAFLNPWGYDADFFVKSNSRYIENISVICNPGDICALCLKCFKSILISRFCNMDIVQISKQEYIKFKLLE